MLFYPIKSNKGSLGWLWSPQKATISEFLTEEPLIFKIFNQGHRIVMMIPEQ